jgi:hypothetical protein
MESLKRSPGPTVLTLLFAAVVYVLYRFSQWVYGAYKVRTNYLDVPSLPRHPIWGNLVNAGERLQPSLNRHPDYGFEEIWVRLQNHLRHGLRIVYD